jgi:ATP-binding cassette subfamily B protein
VISLRDPQETLSSEDREELETRLSAVHDEAYRTLADSSDPPATVASLGDGAQAELVLPFGPDTPVEGQERAVVALVAVGDPGSTAPIVDGLLGEIRRRIDGVERAAFDRAVARVLQRGEELPEVGAALDGAPDSNPAAVKRVLSSFAGFLVETQGGEKVRAFAAALESGDPETAASSAFGTSLAAQEAAWLTAIDKGEGQLGLRWFLSRVWPYLKSFKREAAVMFVCTIATTAFTTLMPLSFKFLIDNAILPEDYGALTVILVGLAGLFLLQALGTLGLQYMGARVGAGMLHELRTGMFERLQRLSARFHHQADTGDLMARMSDDLYVLDGAVTQLLPQFFAMILGLVASVVILVGLNWQLALGVFALFPPLLIAPALLGRRSSTASVEQQAAASGASTELAESLATQPVVRAFGLESRARERFDERSARLRRATTRSKFLGSLIGASAELGGSIIQLLAVGGGAWLVIRGDLELGSLVAFTGLLSNVMAPLFSIADLQGLIHQASGGLQRIQELLDEEPDVSDAPEAVVLGPLRQGVQLDNVSFGYESEIVLRNVSLDVPLGQTVALVGPSGAGKSTVLTLVMREYDPVAGAVRLDGQDARGVTLESLRARLGIVFQEPVLFNLSVRENIRLGRPQATDAEVEAAARDAEVHDAVTALPFGYDTLVGERGGSLSGGQRQRVALARALVRNPDVLLLDEPTSALDPEAEAAVVATLRRLSGVRAMVFVTHRLASVTEADRIIVLERGRVVGQGSHQELLEKCETYERLWAQQHGLGGGGAPLRPRETAKVLAGIPALSGLDDVTRESLAARLEPLRYREGQVVVREGDPGDALFLLARGEAVVTVLTPAGEQRSVRTLRDGDHFGEVALVSDGVRTATVTTTATSDLLVLKKSELAAVTDGAVTSPATRP